MRLSPLEARSSRLLAAALLAASAVVVGAQSSATECAGPLGPLGWQCTTVDASADTGSLSRLAYASNDTPLIAYTQNVRSKGLTYATALRFATRTAAGAWTTQTIDAKTGGPSVLQLNPANGHPAIAYGCLKLAEFNGTTWAIQTVVARGCGAGGAFAYDQAGTAFAAYSDGKNRLLLGQRNGSTWTFQTSDQLASAHKSMAVGPDGQPAIAFENVGTALMFGRRQPDGSWQFTQVDPELAVPSAYISHVHLAFDSDGAATIAYHNSKTIRYAREDLTSGTWTVENVWVDPQTDVHLSAVSLTHAGADSVVAFQRFTDSANRSDLLVSRRVDGVWTSPSVIASYPPAAIPSFSSLANDSASGLVGLSYVTAGSTSTALRFAEGPPSVIGN